MASFYDDDNARSSDNDEDEEMEDLDGGDADNAGDMDADAQNEDDNADNMDDDDQDETQDMDESPSRPSSQRRRSSNYLNGSGSRQSDGRRSSGHSGQASTRPSRRTSAQPEALPFRPILRPEAVTAITYDIVPTIAAPHATSINAITATPDMRWVFSGGSDGWIRKFYWVDTVNGKSMLTVAQRHPFVESVQKAGVLNGYWENEETNEKASSMQYTNDGPSQSAVYSLAVQHQALWLLSGTESGTINLYAVRHEEGKRITRLFQHKSAVSVMCLSGDETSVLTGSWDKTILDWDLNTGQVKRSFTGSGGQISAIEMRPLSDIPVPRDFAETQQPSTTFSADNTDRKRSRGSVSNGVPEGGSRRQSQAGITSPTASLFGESESLFGENGTGEAGMVFEQDDENEFSKAFASDQQTDLDGTMESFMQDQDAAMSTLLNGDSITNGPTATARASSSYSNSGILPDDPSPNKDMQKDDGSHQLKTETEIDDTTTTTINDNSTSTSDIPTSETTFLDAAIDGTLRIWDRRQPNPVARIVPSRGTPPWCMHACWSHDGNFIYAGRRNGTIDEYSLHKGLKEPGRTLQFPGGSGPVSAVRAMPNGRHLICASYDILRLYDLADPDRTQKSAKKSSVPFLIVPGHRTGVVSQLYLDTTCSFLVSTGGNRGWEGNSTEVLLGYEVGFVQ